MGLVVTVVEVRSGDVRRDGVGVFLAGVDRMPVVVGTPSSSTASDAVEVDRVRAHPVGVVQRDLHVVALGRPENRPGDARLAVVGAERPHLREFDRPAHRFEGVGRVWRAGGQGDFAALFVNADDLRGRRGREVPLARVGSYWPWAFLVGGLTRLGTARERRRATEARGARSRREMPDPGASIGLTLFSGATYTPLYKPPKPVLRPAEPFSVTGNRGTVTDKSPIYCVLCGGNVGCIGR